ncbi:DUF3331 domain-containing protein [Caballeronia glebae]|uniref:DUF3331 domain-containing protein n=1 Tax=Caballeronia glebae TaxID=1777143 RepID=UPI000B354BE4|nr:DUF3331 domain-containing protein [Caballeronia glebae]
MEDARSLLQVSVLEKLSSTTISVRWSDPCSGHYASQIWGAATARASSICVLSGEPIRRGDLIFRPRAYGAQAPMNHHRMILASVIAGLDPESPL